MFIELAELPELTIAEGVSGRIVTSDTMTVVHMDLAKGARMPEHQHCHERIVNVVQGELELVVEGTSSILKAGRVMVLPPNVKHAVTAVTDVKVIDVFHPVR